MPRFGVLYDNLSPRAIRFDRAIFGLPAVLRHIISIADWAGWGRTVNACVYRIRGEHRLLLSGELENNGIVNNIGF